MRSDVTKRLSLGALLLAAIWVLALGLGQQSSDAPPDRSAIEADLQQRAQQRAARLREIEDGLRWREWGLLGTACADGWLSPSLGTRGACSSHGGVVNFYENDAGEQLRCLTDARPPWPSEAAEQILDYGNFFCIERWARTN